jgi:hypothetical protein
MDSSNQMPSNQMPSNQMPSNQMSSNQMSSNQMSSNQMPTKQSPYEALILPNNAFPFFKQSMFYYIHIWMLFTLIICFFTAFVLKIPLERNIIILEGLISTISTTIYYFLNKQLVTNLSNNQPIDWQDITVLRYRGWVLSTPLMIVGFLLFLSSTTKVPLTLTTAITCILLDWLMIFLGYLGEVSIINRNIGLVTGFIPLIFIFGIMYEIFLKNKFIFINYVMFIFFILFWSLYGLGYVLELVARNYLYNWLDLLSKSGFGFVFAMYFLHKRFKLK